MSLSQLFVVLLVAVRCQHSSQQMMYEGQNKYETTEFTSNSKNTEDISTLADSEQLLNLQIVSEVPVSPPIDSAVSLTVDSAACPTYHDAVSQTVDDAVSQTVDNALSPTVDNAVSPIVDNTIRWANDSSTRNSVVATTRAAEVDSSNIPGTTEESKTLENQTKSLITYAAKKALSQFTTFKVGKAINRYTQPVICIVGVVGNTISMLVMFQSHNRHTSFGIYLGTLALSDTLVLCTSTALWLVRLLSSSPLQDLECQIRAWVINALQMNGYFLILSLTVDRLIAVRFPLKAVVWCSARRAKLVVGVISLIVWPLNVPFYILNHVENKNICTLGTSGSVISFVFPWIAIFVGFVVPFVSLVSMNGVIVVVILSRRRSRLTYAPGRRQCDAADAIEMSESTTSSSKQDLPQKQSSNTIHIHSKPMTSRDRNAIVTLLLVSFTFLFLVAPHYIHMVLFSVTDMTSTPALHADYTLYFNIKIKLYFLNNACNFFLYCMSGTKFRNDVVKLFRGKVFTG